jgi:hypothetical protein
MLYDVVGLREVWLFGAVLLASAVLAWWQRPAVGVLLLTPIAALLVATLLGHFPFSERLLHWMVPIFALLYTGDGQSRDGLAEDAFALAGAGSRRGDARDTCPQPCHGTAAIHTRQYRPGDRAVVHRGEGR